MAEEHLAAQSPPLDTQSNQLVSYRVSSKTRLFVPQFSSYSVKIQRYKQQKSLM